MSEMTIPEIRKAIADLKEDIAKECEENHSNCQACFYERRCSDEVRAAQSRVLQRGKS